jgi:hypothetical protein
MSLNITATSPREVNSTSYSDVTGLLLGLDRLAGESTVAYVDRLFRAAANRRDHSLQGTIDELAFHLGLKVQPGITVQLPTNAQILCEVGRVTILDQNGNILGRVLTATIAEDGYLVWKNLSDVVAALNALGYRSSLLIADAPALQLTNQSNVFVQLNESVTSRITQLGHSNVGSYTLNQQIEGVTVDSVNGILTLPSDPPADLTISYFYSFNPIDLVCSDVALLGLNDKAIKDTAVRGGVLAYQFREFIQTIMSADRSYWSR